MRLVLGAMIPAVGMRMSVTVMVCHGILPHPERTMRLPLRGIKIDKYTLVGYMSRMHEGNKATVVKRLNRIEGQVRGLARMVEEERYCIDIVTQITAVRAALRRVEEEVLREHVSHCVEHAIASGDKDDQRQKIAELMEVLARSSR